MFHSQEGYSDVSVKGGDLKDGESCAVGRLTFSLHGAQVAGHA